MKRIFLYGLMLLSTCMAMAQGLPFLRNFTAEEYHGNKSNFDVVIGRDGTVYVANFEGLMYYDKAEWRMLHNPGITRITVVYQDAHGVIWVGGYNYFGRVITKENGELALRQMAKPGMFRGEVLEMWEKNGLLHFLVNDGNMYMVKNNKVVLEKLVDKNLTNKGLTDIVNVDAVESGNNNDLVLRNITQELELYNGYKLLVWPGKGIVVTDATGHELYTLNEDNGLCNNNVSWIDYDGHGMVWGVTDNGVFALEIPSVYSRFTSYEGLKGDVTAIDVFMGRKYVGTSTGLFRQVGRHMEKVPGINHACWGIVPTANAMYVATANGTFRISGEGTPRQLTTTSTTGIMYYDGVIYTGEQDGIYTMTADGNGRKKICKLEMTKVIQRDAKGRIWARNLYGEVWRAENKQSLFRPYKLNSVDDNISTLVPLEDSICVINILATSPFPYPQFSHIDKRKVTWLTNNEGKGLYRWKYNRKLHDIDTQLFPFNDNAIRALYNDDKEVWLGLDNGLTVINLQEKDPALTFTPKLSFRSVVLNGDSVLWGGYGEIKKGLLDLDSDQRDLRFTFSLSHVPLVGKTLYRHRLNNGSWSAWDEDTQVEYLNLSYGSYKLSVQAKQANGKLSEIATLNFSIAYPFYMRWYMGVLYVLLFGFLVMLVFRYRLHRLNMEKQKLERIVKERTSEVVKQKDEIEEKSKSLEKALDDLNNAQHELIRQEKMATVGKLTQGLIDRILNPLNYINNFSKLSEGLVKDIEANIEDDKANMDKENYEDTVDVLDMLRVNLQKVGQHGQNTTRTLKAMEEMLKDRSGGIVPMSLTSVLKQDFDMLNAYYADDISKYSIKTVLSMPEDEININGNATQLSRMVMSIVANAVYAVVKKAKREQPGAYVPEISLKAVVGENNVSIIIRDNGIGIEDTIKEKIFDPFFTTKTTGEAAGVGLYLSREIVQNHGGDIQMKSVKDNYSEFTIMLPT
ncbi:MAG: hypothetical protein IKO58_00750 [Prevotella sp.]|nr:hypothetical protein [Prevotella sp.]